MPAAGCRGSLVQRLTRGQVPEGLEANALVDAQQTRLVGIGEGPLGVQDRRAVANESSRLSLRIHPGTYGSMSVRT